MFDTTYIVVLSYYHPTSYSGLVHRNQIHSPFSSFPTVSSPADSMPPPANHTAVDRAHLMIAGLARVGFPCGVIGMRGRFHAATRRTGGRY